MMTAVPSGRRASVPIAEDSGLVTRPTQVFEAPAAAREPQSAGLSSWRWLKARNYFPSLLSLPKGERSRTDLNTREGLMEPERLFVVMGTERPRSRYFATGRPRSSWSLEQGPEEVRR